MWSRPEYVIRYLTASTMYGLHEMEQGCVKYYRVWPVHVRMRLIVCCLNCTCTDARNGWTLILWEATTLHSWRKWGTYTSHPTLFYLFHVCTCTEEGLALCNTDTLSVWTVCMCCMHYTPFTCYKQWKDWRPTLNCTFPSHYIRSEKMLAYVALHFPSFTYCKQWNNEGRNILFSIFTRAPVCKLLINYPIIFYTATVLNC